MESVVRQDQPSLLFGCQAILDQSKVKVLIAAVEFVANDRMADVCQMNADLMLPTGMRTNAENRELGLRRGKIRNIRASGSSLDPKLCARWCAIGSDAIFDGNEVNLVLT